ncbi:MAG TPA: hypothetical protein VNP72_08130 [Longimicrobium sp.]|nr:hypothetical protein [Longimicrobium sp.]
MEHHITKSDDPDFDVTVHPGFASSVVVTHKNGTRRELYRQPKGQAHDCRPHGGHPKKHVIKLKGKGSNGRDVTITIDDPNHSIHSLSFELYEAGRDPANADSTTATDETVTVMNSAETCPPFCGTT